MVSANKELILVLKLSRWIFSWDLFNDNKKVLRYLKKNKKKKQTQKTKKKQILLKKQVEFLQQKEWEDWIRFLGLEFEEYQIDCWYFFIQPKPSEVDMSILATFFTYR